MHHIIETKQAPAPIGPYSQAVRAGDTIYVSGNIAIDPVSGELKTSNLEEETRLVLSNLRAVLQEAGADFQHVVKCSIFLSDMALFPRVNAVYAEAFSQNPPARETVAVAGLPKGVNVEISAVTCLTFVND